MTVPEPEPVQGRAPEPAQGPEPVQGPHPEPVLAAGCVLWRPSPAGHGIEVALVHRPKWDDWSHPKGKRKRGETAEACALREVLEETGYHCELGAGLPTVRYVVAGRPKEVAYWAARALDGVFVPGREVDRLCWLAPAAARTRLTHPRDRELLDALLAGTAAPGGQPHDAP
ncbi:NUDIX domain-containing protein [Streptomyces roseolus]|uniref:NUDIX hydrolase n=1 Tax=Streptomyces roseolus TaxID=67358 RepID=UPI0037BC30A3